MKCGGYWSIVEWQTKTDLMTNLMKCTFKNVVTSTAIDANRKAVDASNVTGTGGSRHQL